MFTSGFTSTYVPERQTRTRLSHEEQFWVSRHSLLAAHGLSLRPRYRPDWKPSWTQDLELNPDQCEDRKNLRDAKYENGYIDATSEDGRLVAVKRVESGSPELLTLYHLSRTDLHNDPKNHCVPVLKHFKDREDKNLTYLVTPFLSPTNPFHFWCVNDIVEFVDDVLEGLAFLHSHGVAHRNISLSTILTDETPLYPKGFHPVDRYRTPDYKDHAWYSWPFIRLSAPSRVRHYFTDFSHSLCQPRTLHIANTHASPDAALPELQTQTYDPFKADVFCLGNLLRQEFRDWYPAEAAFLTPLVREMIAVDPEARPTAADALQRWKSMRRRMWWIQRLRPLCSRYTGFLEWAVWNVVWPICLFNMLLARCARGTVGAISYAVTFVFCWLCGWWQPRL